MGDLESGRTGGGWRGKEMRLWNYRGNMRRRRWKRNREKKDAEIWPKWEDRQRLERQGDDIMEMVRRHEEEEEENRRAGGRDDGRR